MACRCLRRPEATGPYRGRSLPWDTEASQTRPQLRPSQRERNESEAGRPALRRAGSALASSPKSQASGKMPSGRQGWSEPEEVQAPATKASHGGAFGVTRGSLWLRPLPWRQVVVRASPWTSRAVGTGAFCWPSRPAVGLRCVGQKGPGSLRQPVGLVRSLTIHPAELSSAYKRGGDDTASSPRGWQGWTRR